MNLVFIGPQASGKGTQAKIIARKLGLIHISTGDLLRGVQGDFKEEVDKYLNQGELVPDELMIEILKERISKDDAKKGFILDGFPRNLNQAEELNNVTNIDKFIEILIPDDLAVKRLSGRVNCSKCGEIYNLFTFPKPKKKGVCDKCSNKLSKRDDDNEEAIRKRLAIYHKETEPILRENPSLKIDGTREIEKVTDDILKSLEKLLK